MNQLKQILAKLSWKQRLSIVVAVATVIGGIYLLVRGRQERDFKALYTGLSAEDAGQLVTQLKASGVEYRLSDGGATVMVRSGAVAEQRLALAGAGLPKTGRMGFELFDRTTFGASDFAEQVNFRRALEGELERTVMAVEEVEHARVHLTLAKESVFSDLRQPAKASVLLKLKKNAGLSPRNVVAISHLVASAVEGLAPDLVSIVDMQGNLLSKEKRKEGDDSAIESPIEYRQRIERDLLAKIQATMEPVMGGEHFRASVSAEVDFSSGEQSEETWDPTRSVISNQQRSEETSVTREQAGIPGTPSSLPRPLSRPGSSGGGTTVRRTENTQYQSSRLVKRTKLPQGVLRRVSASVILDQDVRWQGSGKGATRVLEPPSEETLKKVRDLVAGAIGYQEERGDQIFVQSLPFEATLRIPPPPAPEAPAPAAPAPAPGEVPLWMIGAGVGLAALGAIAAVVLRRRKRKRVAMEMAAALERERVAALAAAAQAASAEEAARALEGAQGQQEQQSALLEEANEEEKSLLNALKGPVAKSRKAEVLARHIAEEARKNPAMVATLVRGWLGEKRD